MGSWGSCVDFLIFFPVVGEGDNYCTVHRDRRLSYGDDPSAWLRTGSERLTFLLLQMVEDEHS
jgi:hypothetical protein